MKDKFAALFVAIGIGLMALAFPAMVSLSATEMLCNDIDTGGTPMVACSEDGYLVMASATVLVSIAPVGAATAFSNNCLTTGTRTVTFSAPMASMLITNRGDYSMFLSFDNVTAYTLGASDTISIDAAVTTFYTKAITGNTSFEGLAVAK